MLVSFGRTDMSVKLSLQVGQYGRNRFTFGIAMTFPDYHGQEWIFYLAVLASMLKSMKPVDARERLIVALDLPSAEEAQKRVEGLDGLVDFFKIGLTLQVASGVDKLIRSL